MNTENIILSKVNYVEDLPNELFFEIFSYLKSDMIIETFFNLNQRFQSVILQFARHFVLSNDTKASWINKYMLSIENKIETMTLSVKYLTSVFSSDYSYPNLRSIIIYRGTACQIELYIENESPATALVSSLKVLRECSINLVNTDFRNFDLNHIIQKIANKLVTTSQLHGTDPIPPCSAIRRINMSVNGGEKLQKLCDLAPEMTYLKIWFRFSSRNNSYSASTPIQRILTTNLSELYIKINHKENMRNVKLLIGHCQRTLKRIELDLGENLLDDGRKLEILLASCTSLENISFISQFSKEKRNLSDILNSFQSEWWLDTRRPPVLINEVNSDRLLAASIPCSFSNASKDIQFSTDIRSWYLNKGKFDSILNGGLKTNKICFSNERPISLDFLQFAARIFQFPKQRITCKYWGLMFEQELFEQLMSQSIVGAILPNVTRFTITHVNGLSPLTLAIWLLLAPNVRILEIEYLLLSETMEWITELEDAVTMGDQRLKMILQRIQKISISSVCYNWLERSRLKLCSVLSKIFLSATII